MNDFKEFEDDRLMGSDNIDLETVQYVDEPIAVEDYNQLITELIDENSEA
eukprot:CAMPEP_0116928304 /NCGR_PEP_ID=MMETSP0467-20121206/25896_1 /TAXON_ID=283647 /ORGANISM="Mesodinium pulex, Strain SPMC105" /LENGTH=49 /DNA_ID=CAMNT_0004608037 /DNA_START=672 /DNA_END=821 /DNA_ORIENTATION=+